VNFVAIRIISILAQGDNMELSEEQAKQLSEQSAKMKAHVEALRDQMFKIEVEVMDGGKLPYKAHKTDAGFDVFATDDIFLCPGQVLKHPLNIRMKLPQGTWARIETKSGLGSKGQFVFAGVIDETYRGIPHAIMTNLNWGVPWEWNADKTHLAIRQDPSPMPIVIKKGEKLAQVTMNPHSNEYFIVQVDKVATDTDRGEKGFGSSGV